MKKKPRRVVLGVGHPWFSSINGKAAYDSIGLYPQDGQGERIEIDPSGIGGWTRIRLVAEVLPQKRGSK